MTDVKPNQADLTDRFTLHLSVGSAPEIGRTEFSIITDPSHGNRLVCQQTTCMFHLHLDSVLSKKLQRLLLHIHFVDSESPVT